MLEQKIMPPKNMPQPSDAERNQAVSWIRSELNSYAIKHDGDPGRVTVRRLTSGEYAYTIKDLTSLDLNLGIDSTSDSVGTSSMTYGFEVVLGDRVVASGTSVVVQADPTGEGSRPWTDEQRARLTGRPLTGA